MRVAGALHSPHVSGGRSVPAFPSKSFSVSVRQAGGCILTSPALFMADRGLAPRLLGPARLLRGSCALPAQSPLSSRLCAAESLSHKVRTQFLTRSDRFCIKTGRVCTKRLLISLPIFSSLSLPPYADFRACYPSAIFRLRVSALTTDYGLTLIGPISCLVASRPSRVPYRRSVVRASFAHFF